jgi:glycosyltransferase involved in cell wall biosynthesis
MADLILLDLTRLMARLRLGTPTGIDRVEFAYARYLIEAYPREVLFIMKWRGYFRGLSTPAVSKYLEVLGRQWGVSQPKDIRRIGRRVGKFVGDEHLADDFEGAAMKEQRRDARRLWRVRLRLTLLSQRLRLPPLREGDRRIYVNVSHEGLHAGRRIAEWVKAEGLHPVFMLHDLIPLTHPEYVREGHAARHAHRLATMLKHGSSILTNSAATASALRHYAAEKGLPLPPVDVALLSAGFDSPAGNTIVDAKTPYFVVVGTIEPRKNHIFLLHLWRQLAERLGPSTPKLLIIGRRGWENENAIDLIERCAAIQDHVLECGSVPDVILQRLLRGASAVLFPSFAEGYGMPLIEALTLGVPVIASDLEVFREVAHDVPEFLNPLDGPSWARLIQDYADPRSERRKAQLERLSSFVSPTWDEHFHIFERVLDRIRRTAAGPIGKPGAVPAE